MRRLLFIVLFLAAALPATAQTRTFYIDWVGGSNANAGTSQGAAWKSAPGMQTAAGCGGATHSYIHVNGDHFIFKGGAGETWPVLCFKLTVSSGGVSGAPDYWGVCNAADPYSPCFGGTSWPSSSYTAPKFDMQSLVPTGQQVVTVGSSFAGYVTFDGWEIANQQALLSDPTNDSLDHAFGFAPATATALPGTLVENMNIHDWFSNTNVSTFVKGNLYSVGCIDDEHDRITMDHVTCDDTNGFLFAGPGAGTKQLGGIGGACHNCNTVSNSRFIKTWAACFTVLSCHDNEMTGVVQAPTANCVGTATIPCPGSGSINPHTQVVEDDFGAIAGMQVYNNYIHDNPGAGVTVYLNYTALVYNNVMSNNSNGNILIGRPGNGYSTLPGTGYVINNTVDGTNGQTCFKTDAKATQPGPLVRNNNICVTNGTETSIVSTITLFTNGPNNYKMSTTEASAHGFVSSSKYAPSSSDTNTVGQGSNYISISTQDASGSAWFGGSYKNRQTGSTAWDLGAYVFAGGTTGPPTVTITSPSAGTVSGTQTLTATCTPQGTATCSSVQFFIDGFPFGAPDTSSPYTTSWNTSTAANANHVIGATATDSNSQTGTAGTVTVTVNNSIPGCFISTDNGATPLSFTGNLAFTPQSANFSPTVIIAPWTANQNSVFGFSQNPMAAYGDGAVLLRANSSGVWDAYKGSISNYAADNSAPYSAATAYSFAFTINFTGPNAATYSVSETSPSSIVIATNYAFRVGAPITSLGYINSIAVNDTPDTQKVCNFLIAPASTLTFSPVSLNFGNVVVSSGTPTLTDTVTSSGGATTFTSVAITGNADFTINSNSCTGSQTSCTTVVKFAPTATGVESATLTYTDNATGSPQTVAITGTGVAAASSATPSPTSVNLGNVQLNLPGGGVSGPVIVTLTNGPVTFDSTPVTFDNPDFSVASNTCNGSVSLPTCQTTVRFIPSSLTNETATMTYHDNAPSGGNTQTVALQGNGVNFPTISPAVQFVGTMPFSMTIKGKTYSYTVPVTCTNCTQLSANSYSCACQ
jgi:hypothetical protein